MSKRKTNDGSSFEKQKNIVQIDNSSNWSTRSGRRQFVASSRRSLSTSRFVNPWATRSQMWGSRPSRSTSIETTRSHHSIILARCSAIRFLLMTLFIRKHLEIRLKSWMTRHCAKRRQRLSHRWSIKQAIFYLRTKTAVTRRLRIRSRSSPFHSAQ